MLSFSFFLVQYFSRRWLYFVFLWEKNTQVDDQVGIHSFISRGGRFMAREQGNRSTPFLMTFSLLSVRVLSLVFVCHAFLSRELFFLCFIPPLLVPWITSSCCMAAGVLSNSNLESTPISYRRSFESIRQNQLVLMVVLMEFFLKKWDHDTGKHWLGSCLPLPMIIEDENMSDKNTSHIKAKD